jgi:hypothetical protein
LINLSQISNSSSKHEERLEFLHNQCGYKNNPSLQTLTSIIYHRNEILNHLGFVLRSHSLFYCSVPKVATRTLLTYITYLHIRDEIMNSSVNNLNLDQLNEVLSTSIKVNIKKINFILN